MEVAPFYIPVQGILKVNFDLEKFSLAVAGKIPGDVA